MRQITLKALIVALGIITSATAASHISRLKELDVEMIAPSSGVDPSLLKKLGKKCELPTGSSEAQVFTNQLNKFKLLDKALKSNKKILWAFRGGYGVDKLMPQVYSSDYSRTKKKIIIGYSDITPLLVHFSQKYNWIAISAPMLKDFALGNKSKTSYAAILNFLNGKTKSFRMSDLQPLNDKARTSENISGHTTGGNLTCLVSTIGTPWQVKTAGRILFLEDTAVVGYRLDRLLMHMQNAGLFRDVVAIIFGDFGADVAKVVRTFAAQVNLPVFKSSSFGHEKNNLPFGYEFNATIHHSNKGNFQVEMRTW